MKNGKIKIRLIYRSLELKNVLNVELESPRMEAATTWNVQVVKPISAGNVLNYFLLQKVATTIWLSNVEVSSTLMLLIDAQLFS